MTQNRLRNIGISWLAMLMLPGTAYAGWIPYIVINTPSSASIATAADKTLRFKSSNPSDGQVLDTAPSVISITFTQPVQSDTSSVKIYDAYGFLINDGAINSNDGTTLTVDLSLAESGQYNVKWDVHCQCTAATELSGNFRFIVR